MATINISIPESMKAYIEEQAQLGEFTTSEYIRHLVRMDQEERKREKRAQIAQYIALCEQQIASGQSREYDMDGLQKEFEQEYKKSRGKKAKR